MSSAMGIDHDEAETPSPEPWTVGLRESLPLIAISAAFFTAGVITWATGVRLGPSRFSLWGLLLVLGFVAAIGAVLSWFWAGGPTRPRPSAARKRGAEGVSSPDRDPDRGRPAPEVRVPVPAAASPTLAATLPPWDEGPVLTNRAPPETAEAPRPWTDADADVALMELEGIRREVGPRRKGLDRRV